MKKILIYLIIMVSQLSYGERVFRTPETVNVGETITAHFQPLLLINNRVQYATAFFASATPSLSVYWELNGSSVQTSTHSTLPGSIVDGVLRLTDTYTPTSSGNLVIEASTTIDNDNIRNKETIRVGEFDKDRGFLQTDMITKLSIAERAVQSGTTSILMTGYSASPYNGTFAIVINRGGTGSSNFAPRAFDYGQVSGAVGGIDYATSDQNVLNTTVEVHFIRVNVIDTAIAGNHTINVIQKQNDQIFAQNVGSFYHEELPTIDTTNIEAIVAGGVADITGVVLGESTTVATIRTLETIQKVDITKLGIAGDIYAPSGAEVIQFIRNVDNDGDVTVVCQMIEWHQQDVKPASFIRNTTNDGLSLNKIITAFPILAGKIEQVTPPFFD